MKPTLLLAAIGLVTSSLFGYHLMYAPKQEQARVIAAQISQVQADQQAQHELAALLLQVDTYHKRLPPSPDPSWLVREVVALGRTAGIDLTLISQQDPQPIEQYTRLSISVQFQTTYHQLGKFLDILERAEPFIRVDRVDMSSPRETGDATAQLHLSSIYVPPVLGANPAQRLRIGARDEQ